MFDNLPKAITNLIYISHERSVLARSNRVPRMKITTNSEFLKKSVFHRAVYLYSLLPEKIRMLNPKKFNKNILEYIQYNWEPNNIPKSS